MLLMLHHESRGLGERKYGVHEQTNKGVNNFKQMFRKTIRQMSFLRHF